MATDFQRSKIVTVFDAMDADRDGLLRAADFTALASRWTTLRGAAPGSREHRRLTEVMTGWWAELSAAAASDAVTADDVLRVVDLLPGMVNAVAETAEAMFTAIDADGDGRISPAEYRQLIEAWNGRPTDTSEIFPRLDANGDGHLSRTEFTELWIEFWAGDDPSHPGTWIFGAPAAPAAT